jgi:hypothetical protein
MNRWWQDPEDEERRQERLWEEAQERLSDEGIDDPTDTQIEMCVDRLREEEDEAAAEVAADNQQAAIEDRRESGWNRFVDSL